MRDKKMVLEWLEKCRTSRECSGECPYDSADEVVGCMDKLKADALEIIKKQDDDLAAMQCALDKANEKLGYVNPDYFYDLELGREQLKAWYECWRYEEMERNKPMLVKTVEGVTFQNGAVYCCPVPNCKKILGCGHKMWDVHYCPNCGQAVKWK